MDTLEEVTAMDNTNERDIESVVEDRFTVFVRAYVSGFEKKLEEYGKEAEVGGTAKTGKIADKVVGPVAAAFGAAAGASSAALAGALAGAAGGPLTLGRAGASVGEKVIAPVSKFFIGRNHRKRAKKTTQIFQNVKTDELRKMLVEAGTLIYYSFQNQFDSVTDADGNWKRALSKLAIDARNRSISYLYNEEMNFAIEELSKDLLTKAVIKGESKDGYLSHVTHKKLQKIVPGSRPGHTVIHEGKEWKTSDIYEKAGIKMEGNNGQTKYYKEKKCGIDCGYRWAFNWEDDSSWISTYEEEDCSNVSEDHRPSLKLEELEARMDQLLTNINMEDTKLQLDRIEGRVDESKETLERMQLDLHDIKTKLSSELPNSDQPKIFNVTPPVKTFTGRERELTLLHEKLQTPQKHVVVSQCASISGLGGMGKSEIARKYAHTYHEYYGSCIWIDSETQSSIKQLFHGLAEKLKITIMQKISDSEKLVERNILLIVEDIYKRFSRSKSLFIFDNVNEYEEIKDYLPSNLSPTDEKPTIIITSRNRDWDIGDEGDVGLILLDQFTPEEALSFVKKVLEIKDEDTSHDSSISELTEVLCCFPLALRQAASYIKAKKRLNAAIQSYLVEFRDEKKKRDLLKYKTKRDRYTETTYTTWQLTFRNIEKHEANGPLAIRLVEIMSYLAADNIPLTRFIGLSENVEKLNEAVDILLKYSMITINDQEEYNGERKQVANIHRLVQQVIRLWLQDQEREKDVLRTALTRIRVYASDHVAALWSFACNYTTLINSYLCNKNKERYDNFTYALNDLVRDGDSRTIQKILNYFEGRNDLWREISHDILKRLVKCNPNDATMENTAHETHIKDVLIFHAEVFNALKHSNTKDLGLFLQSFDKSFINWKFDYRTALETSAKKCNLNVVKVLVENGADVNSCSGDDCSILCFAVRKAHPQVAEYLLDHGARMNDYKAFLEACYLGYLNIAKRLVDSIANFEVDEGDYLEPFDYIIPNDQVEIVEFLGNHEVYRSAMKHHGQRFCHYAAEDGSIQVVKYFIDNKLANVNGRDCYNDTLLIDAVRCDHFDIVKYLLTDETHDKVHIDAHNVLGFTPLFQAGLRGNVQIARFLIEHGAAVENVQNGNTLLGQLSISALHFAAANNHIDMAKLLVEESKADINLGLKMSFSPLQVAKYFNSERVCEFLIRNGADTSEWCKDNLDKIIRIIRSFCEENEKSDIIDAMFKECRPVLYDLRDNRMHQNHSEHVEESFKILDSYLKQLELDIRSTSGIKGSMNNVALP